jgi:hypothetical protein
MAEQPLGDGMMEMKGAPFLVKVLDQPRKSKYIPSHDRCQELCESRVIMKVDAEGNVKVEHDRWCSEGEKRAVSQEFGLVFLSFSIFMRKSGVPQDSTVR